MGCGIGPSSCRILTAIQFGGFQFFFMANASVLVLGVLGVSVVTGCERQFGRITSGLPKSAVDKLHVAEYRPAPGTQTALVCTICMETVKVGELFRKLLCGHGYHKTCIDTW